MHNFGNKLLASMRKLILYLITGSVIGLTILTAVLYSVGFVWSQIAYNGLSFSFWEILNIGREEGIIVSGVLFLLIFGIAAWRIFFKGIRGDGEDRDILPGTTDNQGTSRFMSKERMRRALSVGNIKDVNGIILGTVDGDCVALPMESMLNKHIFVCGAPGSMKNRAFLRPNMMQASLRGESMIIADSKGTEYQMQATYLEKLGYEVKVFNLVNLKASDSWDCLGEISEDLNKATLFATVVMANLSDGKAEFWLLAAKNLLKAMCLIVASDVDLAATAKTDNQQVIGTVYKLITTGTQSEFESTYNGIMKNNKRHVANAAWSIYAGASEKVRQDVRHEIGIYLEVFQNPEVVNITSYNEINLTLPAVTKCAYFVVLSDQHTTYQFLSSLFFNFLFVDLVEYADAQPTNRCKVPVNLYLDEFSSIGKIDGFLQKLSSTRSRGINICTICQALPQIQVMYPGKEWESLIACTDTQIYLGSTDETTAKYISQRAGIMGVTQNMIRETRPALSPIYIPTVYQKSQGEGHRNLLNVDEVYTMDIKYALVSIRGEHILRVEKFDYTKHPLAKKIKEVPASEHRPQWYMDSLQKHEPTKGEVVNQEIADLHAKQLAPVVTDEVDPRTAVKMGLPPSPAPAKTKRGPRKKGQSQTPPPPSPTEAMQRTLFDDPQEEKPPQGNNSPLQASEIEETNEPRYMEFAIPPDDSAVPWSPYEDEVFTEDNSEEPEPVYDSEYDVKLDENTTPLPYPIRPSDEHSNAVDQTQDHAREKEGESSDDKKHENPTPIAVTEKRQTSSLSPAPDSKPAKTKAELEDAYASVFAFHKQKASTNPSQDKKSNNPNQRGV